MLMVGMISFYALAAVGVSMQFMMIINSFMTLYIVGGNALISRFIGSGRKKRASSLLYSLIIFAIIFSIPFSLFGFFGAEYIYSLIGAGPEVIELGAAYFKVIACGLVVIFLDSLLYNSLSAAGDTKNSLYIKIVSAFLNAFLNYILIFGNFGAPELGIEGAAIATIIAYCFNIVCYWILINKPHAKLNIIPKINTSDLKKMYSIGWSAAVDRVVSSASFLVFVSIIAAYGSASLAGYQVGLRIEGIAFMPGFGFAIAAMALIGQNIGAKKLDDAYRLGVLSGRVAYMFMGFVGIILILIPEYLASFFTTDETTIFIVSQYLILVGLAQVPLAIVFVYSSALRVAGATKTTLKINIASLWFLRVVPSYIAYEMGYGLIAIFIIMNIETLIKGFIYWYVYQKRSWLTTKI